MDCPGWAIPILPGLQSDDWRIIVTEASGFAFIEVIVGTMCRQVRILIHVFLCFIVSSTGQFAFPIADLLRQAMLVATLLSFLTSGVVLFRFHIFFFNSAKKSMPCPAAVA